MPLSPYDIHYYEDSEIVRRIVNMEIFLSTRNLDAVMYLIVDSFSVYPYRLYSMSVLGAIILHYMKGVIYV